MAGLNQTKTPLAVVETEKPVSVERPILRVNDLAFGFSTEESSTHVLQDVSFNVYPGELLALLGPSGVGKSTLLRVIAGLVKPAQGDVVLETFPKSGVRDFGFVFQDARLMPWRKVLANVEYGLEGLVKQKLGRKHRAIKSLALVGLADKADRWPHELSGGQKQRVGLARALAVSPSLLLMDEPFSSLDPATRNGLQDELLAIRSTSGTSIIFVTHDMSEAVYLADRILVLGGQPATITREIRVEARHPRQRRIESEGSNLQGELLNLFSETSAKTKGND